MNKIRVTEDLSSVFRSLICTVESRDSERSCPAVQRRSV